MVEWASEFGHENQQSQLVFLRNAFFFILFLRFSSKDLTAKSGVNAE